MTRRILSQGNGKTDYFHWDSSGKGGYVIETVYEVEPILERAKMLSEETPGKDFRHAAVIPAHVMDKAMREGWVNDKQKWKDWANDPANRCFRTWPGQL